MENAIKNTDFNFDNLLSKYTGKVRDVYHFEDKLVMVVSDRISAFDVVLPKAIPFKGQILNQIAEKFLKMTSDIVPNWIISVPDPNVTIGKKCETFPVEMVIRGYRQILDRFDVPPICQVTDSGTHSASDPDAYVKAVLFKDVIQTYGIEDVRSVGMTHGSQSNKKLTGDIQFSDSDSTDLYTITNNLQWSGKADCDYIQATNYGARPSTDLTEDDLIQVTIDGNTYKYEVAKVCDPATDKPARIYLKQRLCKGFSSNTVTRVRAKIENSGKATLVIPLPNSKIAATIKSDDDSGITYYSRKQFIESVTIDGVDNTVSIAAQLDYGQQQFAPFSPEDYVLEVYTVGSNTIRYGGIFGTPPPGGWFGT